MISVIIEIKHYSINDFRIFDRLAIQNINFAEKQISEIPLRYLDIFSSSFVKYELNC